MEADRSVLERLRHVTNDERRRRLGGTGRLTTFMCECGHETCHHTLLLSAEEYDARRPGPIVHLAHAAPR